MAVLTSAVFLWSTLLAVPAQVLARGNKPTFGTPKTIPASTTHDDPAWHTIDYHAAEHAPPIAHTVLSVPKSSHTNLTLLDEVGRLIKPVTDKDVSEWKRQLHQPYLSAQQAAQLHVRLGEYELVAEEQPQQAEWHFAQARKLTKTKDPLHGLAAYDSAQTLFAEGAYAAAAAAFRHLLSAKPALHGFNRNACAYNLRDANACAGYHAERSALGIPEPPKLDPLCAAAALAQSLKAQGLPSDKKTVLANIRVTGRGSNLQDVVNATTKLHLDAQIVSADDKGLMALPKPLVAYVEHDHFLSVIAADKQGVSYLCSDCGAWPGGRVNLSWKQWHKLEATHYVVIGKPQTPIAQALRRLQQEQETPGTALGVQLASTKLPQLPKFEAIATLTRRLHGHIVCQNTTPGTNSTIACGVSRQSPRCTCQISYPKHVCIPCNQSEGPAKVLYNNKGEKVRRLVKAKSKVPIQIASAAREVNRFGAQAGDPVNLASGEEEYAPDSDLVVYNPSGPPVVWQRTYNSLWGSAACPDFGMGWSNPYRMQVLTAAGTNTTHLLVLPNAGTYSLHLPTLPSSGNPALWPVQGSTAPGVPLLLRAELDAPPTQNGAASSYHLVFTGEDRTQYVTSSVNIGSPVGGNVFVTQVVDRNRNVLYFNYIGSNLAAIKGTLAPLSSGVPLGTLPNYMPAPSTRTLLTIARDSNSCISHVDDYYGRSVYYHVGTYANQNVPPAYPQSQQELDHVSQVVTTGTASPPDRYVLGYQNVGNGEGTETVPFLHTITVPSPTGTGTQTATINYDSTTDVVTSLVDANGNSSNYNYVDANHTQIIQKDSLGNIVYRYTVGYDMNMSQTTVTNGKVDTNGNNTQIVYSATFSDANDPYRPSQVQDGNGYAAGGANNKGTWTFTWDQYGNCLTATTPRNTTTTNTVSYTNFALGELTQTQTAGKQATTFAYYQPSGLVHTVTSPKPGTSGGTQNVTTTYAYSTMGNLTSVITPGNGTVTSKTTAYNYTADGSYNQSEALGQALTVTDNLGKITHFRYDSQGRTTSATDALGNNGNLSYNLVGQTIQILAPPTGQTGSGRTTVQNTYLYPGGPLTKSTVYDESGNQSRQVAPVYGKEGERLGVAGDVNPVTITYDALYSSKTQTDGNNHVTQTNYNATGNATQTQLANGNIYQATSWDANGNVLSSTDGCGTTVNFVYDDPESRLTDIQYPAASGLNVHIDYDSYGRSDNLTDSTGSKSVTYDDLDLPLTLTTTYKNASNTGYLPAQILTYGYNADESRSSLCTPAGTFNYSYDGRGLPSGLTNPSGESFAWTYLDNGWLSTQSMGSAAKATYSYNALGQVTELAHHKQDMSQTLLADFSNMSHDVVGNRISLSASLPLSPSAYSGSTSYGYDSKGQLTSESSNRTGGYSNGYGYDLAGNPTTWKGNSQSFNNVNQNMMGGTLTFDGNGNPSTWNSNALTWDANNKLTAIGTVMTAGYGADGLRAWKQTSSGRTYFLYDGIIPVCELDSNGSVAAINTVSPVGVLARHTNGSGGASIFYCFDPQGCVSVRLDTSGNVVSSHVNEAWGIQVSNGTGYASDPYAGYGGQWGYYRDQETGLHLLGQRYYDVSSGRFLNRDPAGYMGGMNVYAYSLCNPTNRIDPSGLWSLYRWLYTGDGNACDEVYNAALDGGVDGLNDWAGCFFDINKQIGSAIGGSIIGTIPVWGVPKSPGIILPKARPSSSVIRIVSIWLKNNKCPNFITKPVQQNAIHIKNLFKSGKGWQAAGEWGVVGVAWAEAGLSFYCGLSNMNAHASPEVY